jgi:hypothetical protein
MDFTMIEVFIQVMEKFNRSYKYMLNHKLCHSGISYLQKI